MYKKILLVVFCVGILSSSVLAQDVDLTLTEADYDEILSKKKVGFDESYIVFDYPGADFGPVALRISESYPRVEKRLGVWVKIAKVPNISWGSYKLSTDLSMSQVLNQKGQNILSVSGIKNKTIQIHLEDNNSYTYICGFLLEEDVRLYDLKSIEGSINLKLPINFETIRFKRDDQPQEKKAESGLKVIFKYIKKNDLNIAEVLCAGDADRCISVYAYTDESSDDPEKKHLMESNGAWDETKYFATEENVDSFEVIIAEKFVVKKYPFKIDLDKFEDKRIAP